MPATSNEQKPMMPSDDRGYPIPALGLGTCQKIPFSATPGNSTAIGMNGFFLTLDQPAHVAIAAGATATTDNHYLPAGLLYFFACDPLDRVSVVKQGATDGNAYVSPARKN